MFCLKLSCLFVYAEITIRIYRWCSGFYIPLSNWAFVVISFIVLERESLAARSHFFLFQSGNPLENCLEFQTCWIEANFNWKLRIKTVSNNFYCCRPFNDFVSSTYPTWIECQNRNPRRQIGSSHTKKRRIKCILTSSVVDSCWYIRTLADLMCRIACGVAIKPHGDFREIYCRR